MSLRRFPWWAAGIAAAAGIAGWSIRSTANRPHPIYAGIGTFAIVLACCLAITAFARLALD